MSTERICSGWLLDELISEAARIFQIERSELMWPLPRCCWALQCSAPM